jgi:hypothetical protein
MCDFLHARRSLACEGAFFGSWAHTWQIRGQRNSFVSSKSAIRPVLELANFAAFGVITGQGESVCVWIISGPRAGIT